MTLRETLLLLGVVVLSAAGQITLKWATGKWITNRGFSAFLKSAVLSPAPFALAMVLGAPFLYWRALETVDLARAYSITALTGVAVLLGGTAILGERPNRRNIAGALLCCAGIAVWGL